MWSTDRHGAHRQKEEPLDGPHCTSRVTTERTKQTSLGSGTFCCSDGKRTLNERRETPFTFLQYPPELVLLVVWWRLREKVRLRDLAELVLERGCVFTQEAVRDSSARFAPVMAQQLRVKRGGQRGAVLLCR